MYALNRIRLFCKVKLIYLNYKYFFFGVKQTLIISLEINCVQFNRNDCQCKIGSFMWYSTATRCNTFFLMELSSGAQDKSYKVHKLKTMGSHRCLAGFSIIKFSITETARVTCFKNKQQILKLFTATANKELWQSEDKKG